MHMEKVKTVVEYTNTGDIFEVLFWVGCAGAFDSRAQKVTQAFAKIMDMAQVKFAVLGDEEKCSGDPARRSGNEFVFQMLALQNIGILNQYKINKIVTTCPHCFNTLKNEYPALGGNYEVVHHTTFIHELLKTGRLIIKSDEEITATMHDSCYLGRVNGIYEDPRQALKRLNVDVKEMKRNKENGLCCGAGGAQMFKEDEPGAKRINQERVEEALGLGVNRIVTNCPFCLTMMTDGIKQQEKQGQVMVYDLAEMILEQNKG